MDDRKYSPLKLGQNRAKIHGFPHKCRKNRLISRKLMQNEIFDIYSLTAIIFHIKKNFLLGVAIWWLEKSINFFKNICSSWNSGDRCIQSQSDPFLSAYRWILYYISRLWLIFKKMHINFYSLKILEGDSNGCASRCS